MTVVADVLARFRGDDSGLGDTVDQIDSKVSGLSDHTSSGGAVSQLNEGFSQAKDSAKSFTQGVGEASEVLDTFGEKAETAKSAIVSMFTGAIGVSGFAAALDVAKNFSVEIQTIGVQYQSIFGSGSGQALSTVENFANKMGQSLGATASAYGELGLVTKGHSENMTKDMKAIDDAAVGTGSSIDAVAGSVSNFYETIQRLGGSGGSAARYATTLLTQHIIDPETYNKLRLLGNQGASAQDLLNIVTQDMETQYGGAGNAYSKTLGGRLQTTKNIFEGSDASAMSPIIGAFSTGLSDLDKTMQSQGFEKFTTDVEGLVSAMTKGIEVFEPVAKDIAGVVAELANLTGGTAAGAKGIEVLVAAFVAWKAINFVDDLIKNVAGIKEQTSAEQLALNSTNAMTAAIKEQTAAIQLNNQQMATRVQLMNASVSASTISAAPIVGTNSTVANTGLGEGEMVGTAGTTSAVNTSITEGLLARGESIKSFVGNNLPVIGAAGLTAGSLVAGNAIGGSTGQKIESIGGFAGLGAGIGSLFPGPGTLVGAGIGAVVGLFVNHMQEAQQAAANFAQLVNEKVNSEASMGPQLGTTASTIQSAYNYARTNYEDANAKTPAAAAYRKDNPADLKATDEYYQTTGAAERDRNDILHMIQAMVPGMTNAAAAKFATQQGINLDQSPMAAFTSVQSAVGSLGQGGLSQFSAEQQAATFSYISSLVSGANGESSFNLNDILKNESKLSGTNVNYAQLAKLSNSVGINPADYGVNASNASQTQETSGQAQVANQLIEAQESLKDAQYGVTQAAQQQTEATWGLTQAQFQLGQAEFQSSQAAFQLGQAQFQATQASFQLNQANVQLAESQFQAGRATFQLSVDTTTQADAYAGVSSAINSGYLPANYNIAATLAQTTGLTQQQVSSVWQLVDAYNAAEAAMYSASAGGQSLYQTYTQDQGAVSEIQSEMQGYQSTLQQTLQGMVQYNQQQENMTMLQAGTSKAMAELQLAGYSTSSPEYQNLLRTQQIQSAESTINQSNYTTGLGNEQFQISQAQLPGSQSFQTMLSAAQGIGALQPQLYAAQQALATVAPAYTAANTQLQVMSTQMTGLTSALGAAASADQSVITQTDAVTQANNGVVTSMNNVAVAQNGVLTANNNVTVAMNNQKTAANAVLQAQQGVTQAQWNQQAAAIGAYNAQLNLNQAINTYNSTQSTMIGEWLQALGNYVTTVGTNTTSAVSDVATSQQAITQLYELSGAIARNQAVLAEQQALGSKANLTTMVNAETNAATDQTNFDAIAKSGAAFSKLTVYDTGGAVEGSGPQLAIVHGGEYVLNQTDAAALMKLAGSQITTPNETSAGNQINSLVGQGFQQWSSVSGIPTDIGSQPMALAGGGGASSSTGTVVNIEPGAVTIPMNLSGALITGDSMDTLKVEFTSIVNQGLQELANALSAR